MENSIDREWAFKVLVGSHNYNLNTPESDKDYKVFFFPIFDDLYAGRMYTIPQVVTNTVDYNFHDLRKLEALLWKANINFLEILEGEEIIINPKLYVSTRKQIQGIFDMKKELVNMNLPYLFNACIGMHIEKKKAMHKGTEGTQHLVEKYGYDTKQAQHSYRVLNFLERYGDINFTDFKRAIWYKDSEESKRTLQNIKDGKYSYEEMMKVLEEYKDYIELNYKQKYQMVEPDLNTMAKLQELIKDLVKFNIGIIGPAFAG